MNTDVSSSFHYLTNEVLENVLRKTENDDTISVKEIDTDNSAFKGDHYGSSIVKIRIKITRQEDSENRSLILKTPPKKSLLEDFTESTAFPREIQVYSEVMPKMHKLLSNSELHEELGAKYYYSKSTHPSVLMLEDLSVSGFRLVDRSIGLDLAHSKLVMKTLGKFHASSIPLYDTNPDMFKIFLSHGLFERKSTEDYFTNLCLSQIRNIIEVVNKWPEIGRNLAEKLERRSKTILDEFKNANKTTEKDFKVLAHGDFWVNNMMFRYDDVTGHVKQVKFVDFQLCTVTSPVIDLYHVIYTSITDDVRQHHTEDLLKIYHTELRETLSKLGYGHKVISFETLCREYEKRLVIGLMWTLVFLPLTMTKRGEVDLDSIVEDKSDTKPTIILSKNCETALKRLIPIFETKGLL